MTEKFSLQPLLNIMQERSDEATRKLGKLIAAENNEKSRLQMLENYRLEYSQNLIKAAQNGLSPITMANYQDFLARIDEAIESQKKAVVPVKLKPLGMALQKSIVRLRKKERLLNSLVVLK